METSSNENRGRALKKRWLALGIKSVNDLHRRSKISREAITAAEEGTASETTYDRLESWLDKFEHATSSEADEAAAAVEHVDVDVIEVSVEGIYGVARVAVKGSANHPEAIRGLLADIFRDLRDATNSNGDETQPPKG